MLNYRKTNQSLFFIILVVILMIGIFFRCYNVDRKVYWHDEVFTSIRTAGYNGEEVVNETFTGKIITPQELLKYQVLSTKKGWQDTLNKLIEHPEHPPLYYLLSRGWQELFGSSIAATRSLSVFFALLLFPSIFWLSWELFTNYKTSCLILALTAVSPVHVLYSQEAREYSLLTVTIVLASASLIRAIKSKKIGWWIVYGFNLALNFYVSLVGLYLAIAHTVYVALLEKFKVTKTTISFVVSGLFASLLFVPWIIVIIDNYHIVKNKTSWSHVSRPFIEMLPSWELHLSSIFFDVAPKYNQFIAPRIFFILLLFVVFSFYSLYKNTSSKVWLFVFSITIIPASLLIFPDLINGGIKSIMTRYFFPSIVGIQLAVAYWLTSSTQIKLVVRNTIFSVIIVLGIFSCSVSAIADTWWNKVVGYHNLQIASIINEYQKPLIVSSDYDINVGSIISVSYLLEPKVRLLLVKKNVIPSVTTEGFSDVLIWNLSEKSFAEFARKNNCELEIVPGEYFPPLWLMKKS